MIDFKGSDVRSQAILLDFTSRLRKHLDTYLFGRAITLKTRCDEPLYELVATGFVNTATASGSPPRWTVQEGLSIEVYWRELDPDKERITEALATRIVYNLALAKTLPY